MTKFEAWDRVSERSTLNIKDTLYDQCCCNRILIWVLPKWSLLHHRFEGREVDRDVDARCDKRAAIELTRDSRRAMAR